MNALECEYLARNHFARKTPSESLSSTVIYQSEFVNDGFTDKRQIDIIKAQFGDKLKNVGEMRIAVKLVGDVEFDVELEWSYKQPAFGDAWHSSAIGGEGLYELVSQAIVLANIDEL